MHIDNKSPSTMELASTVEKLSVKEEEMAFDESTLNDSLQVTVIGAKVEETFDS